MRQPEMVGRAEELADMRTLLDDAVASRGRTVFIAGEAGIGKTRLVTELLGCAGDMGCDIVRGWCLAESMEPLMPVREALRDAGMLHLVSGHPPPLVVSSYLMNDAGMLIAKAERGESGIDPDIFAGMLQAVGNFVKDSFEMMSGQGNANLNSLGYGNYTILLQTAGRLTLATVTEGERSEFLMEDMRSLLAEIGSSFDDWKGNMAAAEPARPKVSWFLESGKYDGKFLADDPKLKRENLFDSVLLGLRRASAEKPLVIFLDDLQWADPTTLNLLHYLSRNTRQNRVLIVGTYRPEDLFRPQGESPHPLSLSMQNMSREGLFTEIQLHRLDAASTHEMIGDVLGLHAFDETFFSRVFTETEGSPFFVIEVLRLLAGNKTMIRGNDEKWVLAGSMVGLDIPSKVYDVVKRRLDKLSEEQRDMLECASVVGEEFRSELVERAAGINRIRLLKQLNDIEKMHRLVRFERDRYRFEHAKIREVLYSGIGEELRREYHRTIADAIGEMNRNTPGEALADLAYHYHMAGDPRAVDYLVMAGDDARARYANEEAVRFYQTALPDAADSARQRILESLADVHMLTADYGKALDCLGKAHALAEGANDSASVGRVLRKTGETHEKMGNFDMALEALGRAKASEETEPREWGRTLTAEGSAFWRKGDYASAMARFREAIAFLEKVGGADEERANALRMIGNIHISLGEKDEALECSERSLELMESIGNQYGISSALNNIGIVYRNMGNLDRALECYARSLEIRNKMREKRGIAFSLINMGNLYWDKGDLDSALGHYMRSLGILEAIQDKHGLGLALNNAGLVHTARGDLDLALKHFARCHAIKESIGDKEGMAMVLRDIGMAEMDRGNLVGSVDALNRSLNICEELGDRRRQVHALCGLARAAVASGDVEAALARSRMALAISRELDLSREVGMCHRTLGVAFMESGDKDSAESEFNKAMKILGEVGEKVELAELLFEQAALLAATGRQADAMKSLERAKAMFMDMGMRKRADRCARAMGGT